MGFLFQASESFTCSLANSLTEELNIEEMGRGGRTYFKKLPEKNLLTMNQDPGSKEKKGDKTNVVRPTI